MILMYGSMQQLPGINSVNTSEIFVQLYRDTMQALINTHSIGSMAIAPACDCQFMERSTIESPAIRQTEKDSSLNEPPLSQVKK